MTAYWTVLQGDADVLQLPASVPLVATYRVVAAADALVVTPKKENANIAVQMNPTRILFKMDVLLIILISISKYVSAFWVTCQTSLWSRLVPVVHENSRPLFIVSRPLTKIQILSRDRVRGLFFNPSSSYVLCIAPEGAKLADDILILLFQNRLRMGQR